MNRNESTPNAGSFPPLPYPTALDLGPSAPSISPPARTPQQQESGLLSNAMSNDVQNAADFNAANNMGPGSGLYDSTFNVPLDLTLASILDQGPYSNSLQSTGVLDQKNGQKEAEDFFSELMMNSEREIAFLLRHFCEFIAPW
jgi:hypothetical protein